MSTHNGYLSLEEKNIITKSLVSREDGSYIRCLAPSSLCWRLLKERELEIGAILVLFCCHTNRHVLVPSGITGRGHIRWHSVVSVPEGRILLFHTHPGSVIPSPSAMDYHASSLLGWSVVSGDFFLSVSPPGIRSNVIFYYDPQNLIEAKMLLIPQVRRNSC